MESQQVGGETESGTGLTMPPELSSARAKLVYHSLAVAGECSVEGLAVRLGLPKSTLFPIVATLRERGCVDRSDRAVYAVTTREGENG